MTEHETPVITFMVRMNCDCGGTMQPVGVLIPLEPPWWVHQCDKCGKRENLRRKYPYFKYKEAEE